MTSKQDGAVLHLHQDCPVGPEVGGAEGAHPGNDGELSVFQSNLSFKQKEMAASSWTNPGLSFQL
jgi:hypothetical protein